MRGFTTFIPFYFVGILGKARTILHRATFICQLLEDATSVLSRANAFNHDPITPQLPQIINHHSSVLNETFDMRHVGGPNQKWSIQRISHANATRGKNLTKVFVRTKCFLAGYADSPMDRFDMPAGHIGNVQNVNVIPSPIQSPGMIPNNQLTEEEERAREILSYQGSVLYQSYISQHVRDLKYDHVSEAFSYLQTNGYGIKEESGSGAHPSIRFVKVNPHLLQQGQKIEFLPKLTSLNLGIQMYTEMFDKPDLQLPSKAKSSKVKIWKRVLSAGQVGNIQVANQTTQDVKPSTSNVQSLVQSSASPIHLNQRTPLSKFDTNKIADLQFKRKHSKQAATFKILHNRSDSNSDSEHEGENAYEYNSEDEFQLPPKKSKF